MEKNLTKEDLVKLIRETAGTVVAEVVEASLVKQLDPLKGRQTEMLERMLSLTESRERDRAVPALEKGIGAAQCIQAVAFGKVTGHGMAGAVDWMKKHGHPKVTADFEAFQAKALEAGSASGGGVLIPVQYSQEIIELLRPASTVRRMNPMIVPMPTGVIRIPKLLAGSSAAYVGESTNAASSQPVFGQLVLAAKKLMALVPISMDLVRRSSPAVDVIVRDDLVRAMAQRESQAFLRDDGLSNTPKGLLHWIPAGNKANSAGTSLANMITDLSNAILLLLNANVPMSRPGWILSPRSYMSLFTIQNANGFFVFREEMMGGRLWGWPYVFSTQVPGSGATGELYFADWADAVIGETENLIIDGSQEAAYWDSSQSAVISAFSQDQMVIRAIAEHDFGLRRDVSASLVQAMSW